MLPGPFGDSRMHCEIRNAEVIGQPLESPALFPKLSGRSDLVWVKLGSMVRDATSAMKVPNNVPTVFQVLFGRDPFKVTDWVISFVPVFMVDLVSFGSRANEVGGYQTMNCDAPCFALLAQGDMQISPSSYLGLPHFSPSPPSSTVSSVKGSDPPLIGNLIDSFIALDVFPSFCHSRVLSKHLI